jgi:hypothetical protein
MSRAEFDDIISATLEAVEHNSVLRNEWIENTADRIFLKVGDALAEGRIRPRVLPRPVLEVAERYGLSPAERLNYTKHVFEEFVSIRGQDFKHLSDLQKQIGERLAEAAGPASFWARLAHAAARPALRGTVGAGIGAVSSEDELKGAFVGGALGALAFGPRGIRTWRAIITSQPATTIRNALVGGGVTATRLYTDIVENSIEAFTRAITAGNRGKPLNLAWRDGTEQLAAMWRRLGLGDRQRVDKLLALMPKQREHLFGAPITDVSLDNFLYKALHTLNRTQEYFWRRARFDAVVHQELRALGVNARELAQNGLSGYSREAAHEIERAFAKAAYDALEVTFAAPKASIVLAWMNKVPQTFLGFPFPRFVANSLDFMYKHSAFGLAQFFGPKTRTVFGLQVPGAPASRIIAQASASIPLFGLAVGIRSSDRAGEKWYEVKAGDRVIDTRPFNPLAAYLFMADLAVRVDRRMQDQNIPLGEAITQVVRRDLSPREVGEAFLGIRGLERTGLMVLEGLQLDSGEAFLKSTECWLEQIISVFTLPLSALRDVLGKDTTFREVEDAGVFGRALAEIPGVKGKVEQPSTTRSTPMGQEPPIDMFGVPVTPGQLRQATGFTVRTKTELERELDRLNVRSFVYASTGDDVVNRMVTERTGPVMERVLGALVTAPGYQNLSDHDKKTVLRNVATRIKSSMHAVVLATESQRLIGELVERMQNLPISEARDDLQKLRNAGTINAAIEGAVLGQLLRRGKKNPQ